MSAVTHSSPLTIVHGVRETATHVPGKFHAPGRPRHFVRRERLLRLLDDLAEYPVTAIVAPAGTGKTVLAADWLAHVRRPCAWLALDDGDRDATELAHSLVTALEPLAPGTLAHASRQLRTGEDVAAALARTVRADDVATPLTLVVDDVHRVDDDEAARNVLGSFVERRPPWLRLLLLSRGRPRLPVDRLRASGELADIDFGALRFSLGESAALLGSLCPDLRESDLDAAAARADGWAAALQLTALAIRSHRYAGHPPSVTTSDPGTDKVIDEYLWEEVLRAESPELVGLLLSTSVVTRVSCGLAEALTERPDAGDLLEEATAAGLFVTAVEDGWFEVHSLVRHLLATRLERRWPDGVRKQHARAAQWFENSGDSLTALDHWAYAERHVDAVRVLSELAVPLLDSGCPARVLEAIERIPPDAVNADPVSAVRYAWSRMVADPTGSLDALAVAESVTLDAQEPSRSRMETLRAVRSWLGADWRRAAATARHAVDDAGGSGVSDPVERFGWRLVSSGVALDEQWYDHQADVVRARAASVNDDSSRWCFEGTRAIGLALAGRPLESLRVADGARRVADDGLHESLRLRLALADAIVARELDRREAACTALEDLVATPTYLDPIYHLVAQLELVRVRMSAGDLDAAFAQLDAAEAWHAHLADPARRDGARSSTSSDEPCDLVARVGVELQLAKDDPATALRWSAQLSDTFWGPTCEAKVLLACGRHEEAAQVARRATARCPRHDVVSGLVLGQALAARDRTAATDTVVSTLGLAARHAMLRTVASEGAPVMELIELAAWRVPRAWMDRLRHAMVPVWTGQDAQRPIDDLTDREREVLRLLPSRLTLSEIATELYVSQNTVKFHVRAIYRKLGAVSRAEAVDAAREMRLLPR
jgi:LuxR family maltose regulon positive regulatory protein